MHLLTFCAAKSTFSLGLLRHSLFERVSICQAGILERYRWRLWTIDVYLIRFFVRILHFKTLRYYENVCLYTVKCHVDIVCSDVIPCGQHKWIEFLWVVYCFIYCHSINYISSFNRMIHVLFKITHNILIKFHKEYYEICPYQSVLFFMKSTN